MVEALKALVQEARAGRKQDDTTGLDPVTQAPFFALLKQELAGDAVLEGEVREALRALTVDLVAHIQREIGIVEFWSRPQAQNALRSWIFQRLDEADLLPLARIEAVTDRLMELSRANAHRLVKPSA
jgi:type I restriction enzyme R subunit